MGALLESRGRLLENRWYSWNAACIFARIRGSGRRNRILLDNLSGLLEQQKGILENVTRILEQSSDILEHHVNILENR